MNKFFVLLITLFAFGLFFGCTSPDTFIINNVKVQKIIDVNDFNGVSGQIPFFNLDGNAFTIQNGFDFNSDTNTLSVENINTSNLVPYSGADKDVDLGSQSLIQTNFEMYNDGINQNFELTSGRFRFNSETTIIPNGATDGDAFNISNSTDTFDVVRIGNISDNGRIQLVDSTNAIKISLLANGVSYFNSGNVGIGTTTPSALLHVNVFNNEGTPSITSATSSIFQRSASSASDNRVSLLAGTAGNAQLTFGDKDAQFVGAIDYDNANNSMSFYTNTIKRMTITDVGDIRILADSKKLYFGEGDDASITYDATNLVINPKEVGSGLVYIDGNISAEQFITRTSTYDKLTGKALPKIKDASVLKDSSGDIKHEEFYGYKEFSVTDYSKPVTIQEPYEDCVTIDKNVSKVIDVCEDDQIIIDENTLEETIIKGKCRKETVIETIQEEKCTTKYKPVKTFPHKKMESGVDIVEEIELLRQALYELKTEMCVYEKKYSWCN